VPFAGNKSEAGTVLSRDDLRTRFEEALEVADPERVTFYCGSGVGAAQNVLSFLHAGLGMPKLYPGSWSDWVTDSDRPVQTGAGT
jgi:thiosulfate/3-mercaptopyruvate sulfurtransferase